MPFKRRLRQYFHIIEYLCFFKVKAVQLGGVQLEIYRQMMMNMHYWYSLKLTGFKCYE